jgi:hypothetical protein
MGKMKEPAKKESTKKSFKKKGTKQTKKTITEKKSMQKKSKTPSKTAPKPKPKEKKTKMVKVEIKKKTSTKKALKKETKKEIKKGSAKIKELKPSVKAIRKESKKGKEKIEKKEAVKTSIKKKPTKVKEQSKKKVTIKAEKKFPPKAEIKVDIKKPLGIPVKKVEAKIKGEKITYPVKEEKFPPTPFETLPAEYGENSITLMIVDPYKLFAFWEVREDTLKIFGGNLNMRVYDVTDIDLDCSDANSYCDIPVNDRIGSWYFDVTPEKEFIADIGIMYYEGIFITLARSNKVLPPRAAVAEVGILPERLYETGLPIGYGK